MKRPFSPSLSLSVSLQVTLVNFVEEEGAVKPGASPARPWL